MKLTSIAAALVLTACSTVISAALPVSQHTAPQLTQYVQESSITIKEQVMAGLLIKSLLLKPANSGFLPWDTLTAVI